MEAKPWMLDEVAHAEPEHLGPGFVAGFDRKQGYPGFSADASAEAGADREPKAAGDHAMTDPVPVLVITGPVGAGKSTIAVQAATLLREADIPHGLVDLDWIEQCWPVPADDPENERVSHRNLACMWANFRQAGADRLILARGLHDRSPLQRVTEAVPGAQITVVRLQASLAVLHERIRSREASDPSWYLDAATHGAQVLEQAEFEDHLVDTENRSATAVAQEVLHRVRWLNSTAGAQ
jgi:hypothetical protein